LPEIDDSFSKLTAPGANLSELNIDQRISGIQALRFTKSSLGGVEFSPGQGLHTTRVRGLEWRRGLRRCLAERQPQSQACCKSHPKNNRPAAFIRQAGLSQKRSPRDCARK